MEQLQPGLHENMAKVLSHEARSHIAGLSTDIGHLSELLDNSMDAICDRFAEILFQASVPAAGENYPGVRARLNEIATISNRLITDMQVHDLAMQILSQISHRISGFESLLESLLGVLPTARDPAQCAKDVEDICNASEEFREGLRQKVHQKNLEVGEIELF